MADNTRKPVGDGEVVVRLTRKEAQELADLAELVLEETSWGVAALDARVRTPLGDKRRAALDQEAAMSDERPDKCPTCGSDDPGKPGARLREVERELQTCKRRRESWKARASKYKQRLDIAHTRCDAALSELARTRRHLTTLRDAVEEVLERWDDSEVSEAPEAIYRRLRTALASLDEKEVER